MTRFLPKSIVNYLAYRPTLIKILNNISWLTVDKFLRLGIALVVGVWVARYLGPEQFGVLSYAIAFVGLFGAVASLGLQGVVVRDLVKNPQSSGVILGTGWRLQIFGALIAFGAIVISYYFLGFDDGVTRVIVSVLGFALIFRSSDIFRYWFESHLESKYVVWVENSVLIIGSCLRLLLIFLKAPIIAFVWILFFESLLIALVLAIVYSKKSKGFLTWSFSNTRARELLHDSWPLMLSGVAIMIYMRIDQVMLGQMLGNKSVGIYAAALRISEVWYLFPTMISASIFPALVMLKNSNKDIYLKRIQQFLNLLVLFSVAIGIFTTLFANQLVNILYGDRFDSAASVLVVHIWAGVFVFLGVAGNNWYIAENMQKVRMYYITISAIINILLNFYLIPAYGVVGAAIATLISQALSSYIFDATKKSTRELFWMKTRAIFFLGFSSKY